MRCSAAKRRISFLSLVRVLVQWRLSIAFWGRCAARVVFSRQTKKAGSQVSDSTACFSCTLRSGLSRISAGQVPLSQSPFVVTCTPESLIST